MRIATDKDADTASDEKAASSFTRLRHLPFFLAAFLRHPIDAMKIPMRLSWPASISLQVGTAMVSGALAGAVARNFWDFAAGLFLFPLSSLVIGFIFTGFFFSFFSVFRSTYLDFRRLHSIVVISLVPYFLVHIVSGFLPPLDLIGFCLTSILLTVGLVEQFDLHRKTVISVVGTLAVLYLIAWSSMQVRMNDEPGPSSAHAVPTTK